MNSKKLSGDGGKRDSNAFRPNWLILVMSGVQDSARRCDCMLSLSSCYQPVAANGNDARRKRLIAFRQLAKATSLTTSGSNRLNSIKNTKNTMNEKKKR